MASFFQSMFACLMQNVEAAEQSAAQATALWQELKTIGDRDPSLEVASDGMASLCGIFGPFTWVLNAINEGRLTPAGERLRNLRAEFVRNLEGHQARVREHPELADNDLVRLVSELLCAYRWILLEAEGEVQSQDFLFEGRLADYRRGLKELASLFDKAGEELRHPLLSEMKSSLSVQPEQRRTRAEFVELKNLQFLCPPAEKSVFLIHGRDEGPWRALESLLRNLGWGGVKLAQLPSSGMTVIEKLEHYAMGCSHAIGLFTPDDFVTSGEQAEGQARPNVFLELGWFYGRYGRKYTTIVCKRGTSIPSDLLGVVRLEYVEQVDEVSRGLQHELDMGLPAPIDG